MTDNELIAKIKTLKQVKPREEWVVLAKQEILGEKESAGGRASFAWDELIAGFRIIFNHKLASAAIVALAVLAGTFGFAQNSLPGNWLYSFKKAAEQGQKPFVSESEFNIRVAKTRLDDLSKVVHNNSVKNLAPAINEYQTSVSKVARSITKEPVKNNPRVVKEVAKEVKDIEQKTAEIRSLGVEISENKELDSALVQLLADQIKELESKTLNQDQLKILGEVKTEVEVGYYAEALEKLLLLAE